MKEPKRTNRREFIAKAGMGAAGVMAWPFLPACDNSSSNGHSSSLSNGNVSSDNDFEPDIELELSAVQREMTILPGRQTKVWVFESKLLQGDNDPLQPLKESYLGPIIKVRKGQKIRIRFRNELPEESIVHWHGMHVPPQYDGHPNDVINSGESYVYEFEVMNRAGTYWFHPHPHGRIGPQVYNGLAGMLLVTDEEEESLGLPEGEYDVPVIIQDRTFDNNNQLVYLANGQMDRMMGLLGDRILINGNPDQALELKAGCAYRLRLLNGSNSRIYKLAWSDDRSIQVLGTDGGLLNSPKELPYLILGPGQRIDMWLDLRDAAQGSELSMNSLSFPMAAMPQGMMGRGGMMGEMHSQLPQGSDYPVFSVRASSRGSNNYTLPDQLSASQLIPSSSAHNLNDPRQFSFAMRHMEGTVNGKTWDPTAVSEEEKLRFNTTEVWELINGGGMMDGHGMGRGRMGHGMMDEDGMMGNMMQMAHPIHIHLVQFNILERNVDDTDPELWNAVKDGFVDEGWHDTVLLMPGMRVKVIMEFKDFKGRYVYHCHNLEHEDAGMMRNFEVT